jgi:hypothetical protein
MSFSVKKEHGVLSWNDFSGWETRNASTFWCMQQADAVYKWSDFKEITIHTGDFESNADEYTYSKKYSYNRLVPDFNFHSWPQVGIDNYESFVQEIDKAGRYKYYLNKVGWIGNSNTNQHRKILLDIGRERRDLFDIFDCGNWWKDEDPNVVKLHSHAYISTPDLVQLYSILIDIEGGGYSGRLKHLLWSHRPVLLVDRPHKEFFYEHLIPWEHYIPVQRDLSDLVYQTEWCLDNYEDALEIAENAYQFSKKYLSMDACHKQWNTIIQSLE